jgi:hypothetical protein
MQALETYLLELHGLAESPSIYADPKAFMQDMRNYVLSEVSEDDLGVYSLFLFSFFSFLIFVIFILLSFIFHLSSFISFFALLD